MTVPILGILCCALLLIFTQNTTPILIDQFEALTVLSVLSAFLVIALVVERAVEVIITYAFDPTTNAIYADVKKEMAKYKAHNKTIAEALRMVETPHERMEILSGELNKESLNIKHRAIETYSYAQGQLVLLKTPKTLTALAMSLTLGFAICISGFRILYSLGGAFYTGESTTMNSTLFEITDIFIGALLIAGGAEGVHQITKKFLKKERDLRESMSLEKSVIG